MIGEHGATGADRFDGDRALLRKQVKSDKTIGHFAVRLFADEFVASEMAPEINAGAGEEFAGDAAEKLNQGIWIGAFRRFLGNTQKEILKGIVGVDVDPPGRTVFR